MERLHKQIYNTYLRAVGEAQGRPYRCRKNFDDLEVGVEGNLLTLGIFFQRYPHINLDLFIEAPYKLWSDRDFFPLDFYTKRKALSCYMQHKKQIILSDPDTAIQLTRVVESLKFIYRYCKEKEIKVDGYITHKDGNYAFLEHLKNDNVSIYALFAFVDFRDVFLSVDKELKRFLFGDLYTSWDNMHRKYDFSKKCKTLSKKGLEKIK
jgi:hypothetical protein